MNIRQATKLDIEHVRSAQKQPREEPCRMDGFPVFNSAPHTFIDLSDEPDEMHTLSVKLHNGDYVTFCVMPHSFVNGDTGCIDIQYHGEGKRVTMIGMTPGLPDTRSEHRLYSLDYQSPDKG